MASSNIPFLRAKSSRIALTHVLAQVRPIKLFEHEQKEQWFLDINPNGRIPALVHKQSDGTELKIWESGAILQYLVDRYDGDLKISYPRGTKEYWEMTCWVSCHHSERAPNK